MGRGGAPSAEGSAGPAAARALPAPGAKRASRRLCPRLGTGAPSHASARPSASEQTGGVGTALPTLAGVQQQGCPGKSRLGRGPAASPPVGAKGYLGSKKPAGMSPALPLPPSPASGEQPRAASPHQLHERVAPGRQRRPAELPGIVCGPGSRGAGQRGPGRAVPGRARVRAPVRRGHPRRTARAASGTRCGALRNERLFNFHQSFPLPGCPCEQGACCVSARFPSPNLNS